MSDFPMVTEAGKFRDVYPEMLIPPDKNTGRVKTEGAAGRRMDRKYEELRKRLNKLGFKFATVVNLNPFPIEIDLGYNGRWNVRGCKPGEPYVKYEIRKPLFFPIEKPEGDRDIDTIMPIEQAQEFVTVVRTFIYADRAGDTEEEGRLLEVSIGVFWFEGLHDSYPEELYDRAKMLQANWFTKLYEEADELWAKSRNRREISDRMRDAARFMQANGAITTLPDWVTNKSVKTVEEKPTTKGCEICGETVGINAALCPKCNTMFLPDVVKKLRPDIYYAQRPNEQQAKAGLVLSPKKKDEPNG